MSFCHRQDSYTSMRKIIEIIKNIEIEIRNYRSRNYRNTMLAGMDTGLVFLAGILTS